MNFYIPKTKKDIISWIEKYYADHGMTKPKLNTKPKNQLYVIFYELRREHDDKPRIFTSVFQQ